MAELQYGDSHMMINLVVWAQYGQCDRHTESHIVTAIATLTNSVSVWQKTRAVICILHRGVKSIM